MADTFLAGIGVVAVKTEGTEGTAETLTNAEAFLAEELSYDPVVNMNPRNPVRLRLSPYSSIPGARSATISFKTLLKGGTGAGVAPEYGPLFLACKFAETIGAGASVTYHPISSGDASCTLGVYISIDDSNGKKYVFNGCRGTFSMSFVIGEGMYINWEFTAADWAETVSASLTGMTYETVTPLVFQGASVFTVGADADFSVISKLDLDIGNNVVLREDVTKSSGYLSAVITSVAPVGNFDPTDMKISTGDPMASWKAGTEAAIVLQVGAVAGNVLTITVPKSQYTEISPGDRNELRTLDCNFMMNRDTGTDPPDHITIAFT